jgi:hypothetical protein
LDRWASPRPAAARGASGSALNAVPAHTVMWPASHHIARRIATLSNY